MAIRTLIKDGSWQRRQGALGPLRGVSTACWVRTRPQGTGLGRPCSEAWTFVRSECQRQPVTVMVAEGPGERRVGGAGKSYVQIWGHRSWELAPEIAEGHRRVSGKAVPPPSTGPRTP